MADVVVQNIVPLDDRRPSRRLLHEVKERDEKRRKSLKDPTSTTVTLMRRPRDKLVVVFSMAVVTKKTKTT
jgi:hypothetical protein